MPAAGAGIIEEPGSQDTYTFGATAGQRVYFQILETPETGNLIELYLTDNIGNQLFYGCLQCGDPQAQTLDKGGQYQVIVGNDSGAGTGVYGFQIANAP